MACLNISQQLSLNDKCEEDVNGKHVGQIRQILRIGGFRLLANRCEPMGLPVERPADRIARC